MICREKLEEVLMDIFKIYDNHELDRNSGIWVWYHMGLDIFTDSGKRSLLSAVVSMEQTVVGLNRMNIDEKKEKIKKEFGDIF